MDEYESVLDTSPVRQGDVFEWIESTKLRPWRVYGVVVTADCDLSQNKTGGILSYVPAWVAEDYLWHIWKDKKFDRPFNMAIADLQSRTTKIIRKKNPENAEITRSAMLSWLERSDLKIPDELGLTDRGQILEYKKSINTVISYKNLLNSKTPDLPLLKSCYELFSKKVGTDSDAALIADFQSSIASLPGDVFHIPTVDGQEQGGIFVMLRHITQCAAIEIATAPDELRFGNASAKRIGRIAPPYRYAMTQNLARVFSDIGLPEEYTLRRKSSSSLFFQSKVGP